MLQVFGELRVELINKVDQEVRLTVEQHPLPSTSEYLWGHGVMIVI